MNYIQRKKELGQPLEFFAEGFRKCTVITILKPSELGYGQFKYVSESDVPFG